MAKKDMTDILKQKAAARAEAMATTKARIEEGTDVSTSEAAAEAKRGPGRPVEDPKDPRKDVTINLKASSHKKLKLYAVMHDTTASALIESWIEQHCVDE